MLLVQRDVKLILSEVYVFTMNYTVFRRLTEFKQSDRELICIEIYDEKAMIISGCQTKKPMFGNRVFNNMFLISIKIITHYQTG